MARPRDWRFYEKLGGAVLTVGGLWLTVVAARSQWNRTWFGIGLALAAVGLAVLVIGIVGQHRAPSENEMEARRQLLREWRAMLGRYQEPTTSDLWTSIWPHPLVDDPGYLGLRPYLSDDVRQILEGNTQGKPRLREVTIVGAAGPNKDAFLGIAAREVDRIAKGWGLQ